MNRAFQLMADGLNLTESQSMEIADLYEPWAAGKAYLVPGVVGIGSAKGLCPNRNPGISEANFLVKEAL